MSPKPRLSMLLVLGLVGLLMGVAAGLLLQRGQDTQVVETADEDDRVHSIGPVVGSTAPDFSLNGIDGEVHVLSDLRGKVVLLNFWATWCAPCLVEMPTLQDQYSERQEEGFVVLAINNAESENEVDTFGRELGLTFPLLLDPGGETQELFRIRAYPTSIFVDPDGVISHIHFGIMTVEQITAYLEQIGMRD